MTQDRSLVLSSHLEVVLHVLIDRLDVLKLGLGHRDFPELAEALANFFLASRADLPAEGQLLVTFADLRVMV